MSSVTDLEYLDQWKPVIPDSWVLRVMQKGIQGLAAVHHEAAAGLAEYLFTKPNPGRGSAGERAWLSGMWPEVVPFRGGRIQLYVRGHGPTVLLVHGWAGRAGQFRAMVDPLADAGFRVVIMDLPAHGRSTGRVTSAPEVARAIQQVLSYEHDVAGVISHSLGGMAAAHAIAQGARVPRLVMINTPSDPQGILYSFLQVLPLPASVVKRMIERVEARGGAAFDGLDVTRHVDALPEATLLIHDRDDRHVPVASTTRIVGVEGRFPVMLTEGLGHNRILADDTVVSRCVAWMRRFPG